MNEYKFIPQKYYTGYIIVPYIEQMGKMIRERKQLEQCKSCKTYQHMKTKKYDTNRRYLLCPKCGMVTIKFNEFPRALLKDWEIEAIDKGGYIEITEQTKQNNPVKIEIEGDYVYDKMLECIGQNDFPTANLIAKSLDISYDKTSYCLRRLVKAGKIDKYHVPFEFQHKCEGSVFYRLKD